jgi:exopolysaccharide production protein ExoQ
MTPLTATVVYLLLIAGLFWLVHEKGRTSLGLWIPTLWLLLASSRSVSQWLMAGEPIDPYFAADQFVLEGSPLDRAVYTSLLVIGLAILIARGKQVARILLRNAPLVLFFLYCAVSLLWSEYPGVAFKRWIKALGDLAMVLIIVSDREPYLAIKRLLSRLAFTLVPVSVLLIKYYPELGRGYGRWDWRTLYTGVALNKNALGVICLLLGLASLWRFLAAFRAPRGATQARQLLAHGSILVMVFWLFSIANSMTALMCFLLAALTLIVVRSESVHRRPLIVPLLLVAVVAISMSVLFLNLDPGLLPALGRDQTLTDRTLIWSTVVRLPENPLIGTGFESFWLGPRLQTIWTTFPWEPFEAHSGYIEVYLNLGWTGIALLALVLARGYKTVMSGWKKRQPGASLMLAFFIAGLVYNFTEAALFRMMAPAWILLLLAITAIPQRPTAAVTAVQPVPYRVDVVDSAVVAEEPA